MKFEHLLATIIDIDQSARKTAGKSVDWLMTLRNWLIGACIVEYEQNGEDRAEYGERVIERLAEQLLAAGRRGAWSSKSQELQTVIVDMAASEYSADTVCRFGRGDGATLSADCVCRIHQCQCSAIYCFAEIRGYRPNRISKRTQNRRGTFALCEENRDTSVRKPLPSSLCT